MSDTEASALDIDRIERESRYLLVEDHPDQQTRLDNETILALVAEVRSLRSMLRTQRDQQEELNDETTIARLTAHAERAEAERDQLKRDVPGWSEEVRLTRVALQRAEAERDEARDALILAHGSVKRLGDALDLTATERDEALRLLSPFADPASYSGEGTTADRRVHVGVTRDQFDAARAFLDK